MNSAVVGVKRRKRDCSTVIKYLELYAWHETLTDEGWYCNYGKQVFHTTYTKEEANIHKARATAYYKHCNLCGLMSKQE